MAVAIILFIVGLLMLIKGGDWFVDGATGIARRFRLPEILLQIYNNYTTYNVLSAYFMSLNTLLLFFFCAAPCVVCMSRLFWP